MRWERGCRRRLLHKFSLLLLLDANMLLDILRPGDAGDIYGALSGWAGGVLGGAEFKPRGKTITLLVSPGIFKDYRSALGRRQYHVKPAHWAVFKKNVNRRSSVGDGTYFSLHKIAGMGGSARDWLGDKYDRAYFEALRCALETEKFADRCVVFASNDRSTCARVEGDFAGTQPGRLHIVSGRGPLESLIMD